MRRAIVVAIVLLSGPALAELDAQGGPLFKDTPTQDWFRSLTVPGTTDGCCSQADCFQTDANQLADGTWIAESKFFRGEWVKVPPARVLKEFSVLPKAVLCEWDRKNGNDEPVPTYTKDSRGGLTVTDHQTWVYCLAPPLSGF